MNDHFVNAGRAAADGTDYPHSVLPIEVERELTALAEKAAAAIAAGTPTPDAILGDYVGLSGLIRSVSVHEGRMLEEGLALVARWNPNLVILTQGLRLPVTPAALEALANNRCGLLARLSFDADARTRASYTPDLVLVNRSHRTATIIDMKRSVASYLDTHRLAELKTRMLAASLILPDWLYKERKRLMVEEVRIAIIDGASGPSDHDEGIWALSEIDDLLEIHGAAETMRAMRLTLRDKVRSLLEAEARRVLGVNRDRPSSDALSSERLPNGALHRGSADPGASATAASETIAASAAGIVATAAGGCDTDFFRGGGVPAGARMIRVGFARSRLDA